MVWYWLFVIVMAASSARDGRWALASAFLLVGSVVFWLSLKGEVSDGKD